VKEQHKVADEGRERNAEHSRAPTSFPGEKACDTLLGKAYYF